jgi:predicted phage-related endonuclease
VITSIKIENDEHWHALRAKHVGGSEVSALFNEHAQMTAFELWNIKAGRIPKPDFSDNERIFWGKHLEPAIAAGVASKTGWTIRKVRRYLSNPDIGLGSSLDHEIVSNDRGPGVLEIKTADWLIAKGWENGEPPLSYMLQVMAYLSVTGRAWGCMAVLVGGNDLRLFNFDRRPGTIKIIEDRVAEFWRSVRDGVEPKPDFAKDGDTIGKLYASTEDGKVADLNGSNRAPELIAAYQQAAVDEKDADARKSAAKGELITLVGDAEMAICGSAKISAKMVKGAHIEYERKPYRAFSVRGTV